MIHVTADIYVLRSDETEALGGRFEFDLEAAYEAASAEVVEHGAISAALEALTSVGDLYRFRAVVIPKAQFRGLRAHVLQIVDGDASLVEMLPG